MEAVLFAYLHGQGSLEAVKDAADFGALCAAVQLDAAGRLRWQLLRRLGLLPWEGRPGRDELLYAAAQLSADRDEAVGAGLPTENPSFDENRYEELKHDRAKL